MAQAYIGSPARARLALINFIWRDTGANPASPLEVLVMRHGWPLKAADASINSANVTQLWEGNGTK